MLSAVLGPRRAKALIILFSGILGLSVYGEEDRKTPRTAGQEFVAPLLRARAASPMPESEKEWEVLKDKWMGRIKDECFSGWPDHVSPDEPKEVFSVEKEGVTLQCVEYSSMGRRLPLYVAHRSGLEEPELVVLNLLDVAAWEEFLATMRPGFEKQLSGQGLPEGDPKSFKQHQGMFDSFKWVMAYAPPTGVGPTQLGPEKTGKRNLRLQAAGQTIDSVRVWDARRAIQTLRSVGGMENVSLWLQGSGRMAGVLTYASLFEPEITRLDLHNPPLSHNDGPFFFNVLQIMDMPQAVAIALERSKVVIYQKGKNGWEYPASVVQELGWETKLQLRSGQVDN
jgi:hypothetical protein